MRNKKFVEEIYSDTKKAYLREVKDIIKKYKLFYDAASIQRSENNILLCEITIRVLEDILEKKKSYLENNSVRKLVIKYSKVKK